MAEAVSTTVNTSRFDSTFKRYLAHTKRALQVAINTKAYFVARKAVWFTDKAEKGKIRSALTETIQVASKRKPGTVRNRRVLRKARDYDAPLAAVIINARRGRTGKKGLFGADMKVAIRDMLAARLRSVAYIKSGWLPAIRALAKVSEKRGQPSIDTSAKQVGNAKGAGIPAGGDGKLSIARIINEAWAKHDTKNSLERVGGRGLQRAFNDETASMSQYIADKMNPAAKEFNAAQR
jgi:hypothetical protein